MNGFERPVAYAAIPGADNWPAVMRFANTLLRAGQRVHIVQEESGALARGAFVVPLARSYDPSLQRAPDAAEIQRAATTAGIELVPLSEQERIVAAPARAVRIGLYGGGGAPFNHAAILAACGFAVDFISDAEVRAGRLAEFDVFLMPGGGERAMFGQIEPLGEDGCRALTDWVRAGGMYIGCCAGSYDCIVNTDEFLAACPSQRCLQLLNAGPWKSEHAVGFLGLQSPGVGVVQARNTRPDHPVMYGMPDEFELVHYNGPVLDPLPSKPVDGASAAVGLAAFSGWTERFTPAERFTGDVELTGPTYLAQAVTAGKFSIAAGELGLGRVVAFGSHPEFGFDLPMVEWTQPARMFVNAVLWQAAASQRPAAPVGPRPGIASLPAGSALDEVGGAVERLLARVGALQARSVDPAPSWLAGDYAMSVFGLTPTAIWRQSLDAIAAMAREAATIAAELRRDISLTGEPPVSALALIDRWVLDERGPEWGQDGGYQGVRALLSIADRMCARALDQWDVTLGPPLGPYDYFADNPYHQVAGSYLAAVGQVGGALQLMRALNAEWETAERIAGIGQQTAATV